MWLRRGLGEQGRHPTCTAHVLTRCLTKCSEMSSAHPCVPIIETICAHGDNFSPANARRRPGAPRIAGIRWCDDSAMAHSDARRHTAPTPSDRHAILVAAPSADPGAHPLPAAHGPNRTGCGPSRSVGRDVTPPRGPSWPECVEPEECGRRSARAPRPPFSVSWADIAPPPSWTDVLSPRRGRCESAPGTLSLHSATPPRGWRPMRSGGAVSRCAGRSSTDAQPLSTLPNRKRGRRPSCDSGSVSHGSGPNPLSRQATSPVRAARRTAQWNLRTDSDRSGTP